MNKDKIHVYNLTKRVLQTLKKNGGPMQLKKIKTSTRSTLNLSKDLSDLKGSKGQSVVNINCNLAIWQLHKAGLITRSPQGKGYYYINKNGKSLLSSLGKNDEITRQRLLSYPSFKKWVDESVEMSIPSAFVPSK